MDQFVLLLFAGIFLLFFLPFPLHYSLVGDIDTIYNLSMFRQMKAFLDGSTSTLCFPAEGSFPMKVWSYYGANFGIGIFHVLFLYLGLSDLWAHWLFMALLFTFNAWTLYLLMGRLFKKKWAVLAALFFVSSHFMFANLDNINSLVFFPSFYALYLMARYYQGGTESSAKLFLGSVLCGAVLIWLSPYNFTIHFVIWVLFLLHFEWPATKHMSRSTAGWSLLIYAVAMLPYIYVYFISDVASRNLPEHVTRDFIHVQSLNPDDLLRVLKNHLYLSHERILDNPLLSKLRSAFFGAGFAVLAAIGLLRKRYRRLAVALIVAGLVLAIGPFISINNMRRGISPVMYPLYELFDLYDTISVPIRFYFIFLMGMTILAGNGLVIITERFKRPVLLAVIVPLIFLENVPMGIEKYDHSAILNQDPGIASAIRGSDPGAVLYLPSSLEEESINYRREYIYMYWQHDHGRDVLNGFPPFLPSERKRTDELLRPFNAYRLEELVRSDHISDIVFCGDLSMGSNEAMIGTELEELPWLNAIYRSGQTVVYKVVVME